jgi:DNA-binding PadR family transcriptional regulator
MAAAPTLRLTELESLVLAIIARDGPITAYKLRKILLESPSPGITSSAGAVYPGIARLKARKLISSVPVDSDGRNAELLMVTRDGRTAVRRWIKEGTPEQLLPVDPLRTRIAHAQILSQKERSDWLVKTKTNLENKLKEIEAYAKRHPQADLNYAHQHAKLITVARIKWIDDVIAAETRQF